MSTSSIRLHAGVVTREPSSNQARARAIDRLPTPYAVALRLRDAGALDEVIAEALGIDMLSLPSLLDLAEAKLAAVEQRRAPGNDPT